MNENLLALLSEARKDLNLKLRILETRKQSDPAKALCDLSTVEGYPITLAELVFEGEEFCAAMLRSVNGGGVEAPYDWNDSYEMFFSALEA